MPSDEHPPGDEQPLGFILEQMRRRHPRKPFGKQPRCRLDPCGAEHRRRGSASADTDADEEPWEIEFDDDDDVAIDLDADPSATAAASLWRPWRPWRQVAAGRNDVLRFLRGRCTPAVMRLLSDRESCELVVGWVVAVSGVSLGVLWYVCSPRLRWAWPWATAVVRVLHALIVGDPSA